MAQYPAAALNPFRLVTKADAASTVILGSVDVASDSGSASTYGSWYQVISSTAAESYITELVVGLSIGGSAPASSDAPLTLQLGVGGAGSEVVKYERIPPLTAFTAGGAYLVKLDVPLHISSGKRVAARIKARTSSVVVLTITVCGLPISQTEGN